MALPTAAQYVGSFPGELRLESAEWEDGTTVASREHYVFTAAAGRCSVASETFCAKTILRRPKGKYEITQHILTNENRPEIAHQYLGGLACDEKILINNRLEQTDGWL